MGAASGDRIRQYALLSGFLAEAVIDESFHSYLEDSEHPVLKLVRDAETRSSMEDAALDRQREFARLFLLPGGVKPYESVYRGDEPLLMRDPWIRVKAFYQRCGWSLRDSALPEDHCAVELSFMAHLIFEDQHDEARAFFTQHVITWMPQLFRDVIDNPHAEFYRSVAEFGLTFLDAEKRVYDAVES